MFPINISKDNVPLISMYSAINTGVGAVVTGIAYAASGPTAAVVSASAYLITTIASPIFTQLAHSKFEDNKKPYILGFSCAALTGVGISLYSIGKLGSTLEATSVLLKHGLEKTIQVVASRAFLTYAGIGLGAVATVGAIGYTGYYLRNLYLAKYGTPPPAQP